MSVKAQHSPVRTVIFPNVAGQRYTLRVYDTHRNDTRGCSILSYALHRGFAADAVLLFEGDDFAGSPMHADDSDATMGALLGFLTLRPGDTDAEYFAAYTPRQLDFAATEAEALALAVYDRFGSR